MVEIVDEDKHARLGPVAAKTVPHEPDVVEDPVLIAHLVAVVRAANVGQDALADGLQHPSRLGRDDPDVATTAPTAGTTAPSSFARASMRAGSEPVHQRRNAEGSQHEDSSAVTPGSTSSVIS